MACGRAAYRVDVTREADLVEEILRIYGYNNIPVPSHVNSALSYAPKPDRNKLMNLAADFLTANGFTEIMSNSLTKAAYYEGLTSYKPEHCVKILNPLSNDLNVMRQTLLFNMLEAVQLNTNHRNGDLKLYEFGNCYFYDATAATPEEPLKAYSEQFRLGDRRNRHRRTPFVEPETGAGIVLYAASDCREAVASFRARPLYAQVRIAPQRSLRGCTLLLAQRQGQGVGANGCRFVEAAQGFRSETGRLLSGDGFRGPDQGYA